MNSDLINFFGHGRSVTDQHEHSVFRYCYNQFHKHLLSTDPESSITRRIDEATVSKAPGLASGKSSSGEKKLTHMIHFDTSDKFQ